jgi:hypothetical protein
MDKRGQAWTSVDIRRQAWMGRVGMSVVDEGSRCSLQEVENRVVTGWRQR